MQGHCVSVSILGIDIGTVFDKEFGDVHLPSLGSPMQRGLLIVIPLVNKPGISFHMFSNFIDIALVDELDHVHTRFLYIRSLSLIF